MKFHKTLGLLAITAGMLLTGCGEGDMAIVEQAAKSDALIVSASGKTYNHNRENTLEYNTKLNLANSNAVSADNKEGYVLTKVTWAITGDGASLWKHNANFDDTTNDYQYWMATYPTDGTAVKVTFTATVSYGSAETSVVYNFLMASKA